MTETQTGKQLLQKAKWIWPENRLFDLHNSYAHFRKDFNLEKVPEKALLYITADQNYRLWINGKYVCRGPARGYQSCWPYDETEVSSFLKTGANFICAEVYNGGVSTFSYVHQSSAGMICAGNFDHYQLRSDATWLCRMDKAHQKDTAHYSIQLGFQEHVRATMDDRAWIYEEAVPEDGWHAPEAFVFGTMPWHDVVERGTPLQRENHRTPEILVSRGDGAVPQNYQLWRNIAQGLFNEFSDARWMKEESHFDQKPVALSASGSGRFHCAVMDMGETVVGPCSVKIEGGKAGTVIDFFFSEAAEKCGAPVLLCPDTIHSQISMSNRLVLSGEKTEFDFYHLLGFRYITIVAQENENDLNVSLQVCDTGYPFERKGSFESSDPVLDGIWNICRRTQQVCSQDAYVDTPWREQAQWWGDARIQFWNTLAIDGDVRLLKRGIRSISGQRVPNGLTYGHAPTMAHSCILPDFSLVWVMTIYDYYYQTGDLSLFEEQLPGIREVMRYFKTEAPRQSGLLAHDKRYWLFLDWSKLKKDGAPSLYNMWYLLTLRTLEKLLRLSGRDEEAKGMLEESTAIEQAIEEQLFDVSKGLFRDGIDEDGTPSRIHSVHSQVFAVMLGLKKDFHSAMFAERIFPFLNGEKLDVPTPSTYWTSYVLTLARETGYAKEALGFIRRMWEPMIAYSTCPEIFNPVLGNSSLSHAWSAHPLFHLQNLLGGVSQSEVAWTQITYDPYFAAELSHVSVKNPTPQGIIESTWERTEKGIHVRLRLPKGITARIKIKGYEKFVTEDFECTIQ